MRRQGTDKKKGSPALLRRVTVERPDDVRAGPVACSGERRSPVANEDLKAKMREALDRKNGTEQGVHKDGPLREKAHGAEVAAGAAPKLHRRKAGGGGS